VCFKLYQKNLGNYNNILGLRERGGAYLETGTEVRSYLNKLRVNPGNVGKFRNTFGKVIGGLDAMEIELAFAPKNVKYQKRGSKKLRCSNFARLFRQGYCRDALFIMYYSLPERVCHIRCLYDKLRPNLDMPHRVVNFLTLGCREGGLAFNPDIFKQLPPTIFCVENVFTYLRLQSAHYFRNLETVLPLVNWFDEDGIVTKTSWAMFDGCRKIFWSYDITPSLLVQSIRTNGDIAISNIDDRSEEGLRTFLQSRIPTQLLRDLQRSAKPWRQALEEWSQSRSDDRVEELFRALEDKLDVTSILENCSTELRARVNRLLKVISKEIVLQLDNELVVDDETGWYTKTLAGRRSNFISEVRIVVEEALYSKETSTTYYSGKLLYGNNVVNFYENLNNIAADPLRWAHDRIVAAGHGVPAYKRSKSKDALMLALKFRPARVCEALAFIGWVPETRAFEFPNFTLTQFGDVLAQSKKPLRPLYPAANLQAPRTFVPTELEPLLEDCPENVAVWSAVISVLYCIVSPAFGYKTKRIAVCGPGSTTALAVYPRLGCTAYRPNKSLVDSDMPAICTIREDTTGLEHELPKNVVGKTSWQKAQSLLLSANWLVIAIPACKNISYSLFETVSMIVPAYLQNLFSKRVKFPTVKDTAIKLIADSLIEWLDKLHLNTAVILKALTCFNDNADIALEGLTTKLIRKRGVTILPESFAEASDIARVDRGLFVPAPLLQKSLPYPITPTETLEASIKITLPEATNKDGIPGWIFDEKRLMDYSKQAVS
jgi:hypothetical protein